MPSTFLLPGCRPPSKMEKPPVKGTGTGAATGGTAGGSRKARLPYGNDSPIQPHPCIAIKFRAFPLPTGWMLYSDTAAPPHPGGLVSAGVQEVPAGRMEEETIPWGQGGSLQEYKSSSCDTAMRVLSLHPQTLVQSAIRRRPPLRAWPATGQPTAAANAGASGGGKDPRSA